MKQSTIYFLPRLQLKRDLKSAGKAWKEIKDALARKEQCEMELMEAVSKKTDAEEELTKATALFQEHKSVAKEKVRELGIKQMYALEDKNRDLKSILIFERGNNYAGGGD